MKIFYPSSISFPTSYVNRLQTLNTAEGLSNILGKDFILGAQNVDPGNGIYNGNLINFKTRKSFKIAWKTLVVMKENKFDIVYCREPAILMSIMVLNYLFFRLKLRYYFESHAMPADPRQDFVIRKSEHVFCVSEGLKEDLHSKFNNLSVSLLRNGIDLETFDFSKNQKESLRKKFGLPDSSFIISYIGGVQSFGWKGDDIFLESRKYIAEKDAEIHFVIAGAKDKELEEIKNLYADSRTTIFGRLDQEQVAQLEVLSDILVLPNKKGDIESEKHTSPIKMFSYMRSGTPIIASDLPSIREVLNESNSYFSEPGNPQALAEKIMNVYSNYDNAIVKAVKAKCDVAEHSWENKAKRIISIIES